MLFTGPPDRETGSNGSGGAGSSDADDTMAGQVEAMKVTPRWISTHHLPLPIWTCVQTLKAPNLSRT